MRPRGDDNQSKPTGATWDRATRRRGIAAAYGAPSGLVKVKFHLGEPFPLKLPRRLVWWHLGWFTQGTTEKPVEHTSNCETPMTTGGESLASAIFSFRSSTTLTDRQIQQEIVRKARYVMKRAAAA
jgi:hypothetical protein